MRARPPRVRKARSSLPIQPGDTGKTPDATTMSVSASRVTGRGLQGVACIGHPFGGEQPHAQAVEHCEPRHFSGEVGEGDRRDGDEDRQVAGFGVERQQGEAGAEVSRIAAGGQHQRGRRVASKP